MPELRSCCNKLTLAGSDSGKDGKNAKRRQKASKGPHAGVPLVPLASDNDKNAKRRQKDPMPEFCWCLWLQIAVKVPKAPKGPHAGVPLVPLASGHNESGPNP